jgi:hypothetical protein
LASDLQHIKDIEIIEEAVDEINRREIREGARKSIMNAGMMTQTSSYERSLICKVKKFHSLLQWIKVC